MPRVLFFGEPATMAHVARPVVLARGLRDLGFDVAVATGDDYRWIVDQAQLPSRELASIGTKRYLEAVAKGRPVYPYRVLEQYVEDDQRVIGEFAPDVIVGDFRLSLAVSARIAQIPYIGIANAYWNPWCIDWRPEIPALPVTRLLPVALCQRVFSWIAPLALAHHAKPFNDLQKAHGMAQAGIDLRRVFTEADVSLLLDVPGLIPSSPEAPASRYRYAGPVVWSAPGDLPPEIAIGTQGAKPIVFIMLGSSGDTTLASALFDALRGLDVTGVMALGQGKTPTSVPANVRLFQFLPGDKVARVCSLVICNGGSPGTHQALMEGTPVLGIPSNMDQLLNMSFVTRTGAGLTVRSDQVSPARLRMSIVRLLNDPAFKMNAEKISVEMKSHNPAEQLANTVTELAGSHRNEKKPAP